MLYLYNYGGQPWKSQYRAREVMDKLYNYTPDGYCGDEDNGQTSAWYVFSALGFYPVCPGTNEYVFGSPLFEKVEMEMPNGQTFTIEARDNTPTSPYIRSAQLNGRSWDKNFITHELLQAGGQLIFEMDTEPNKKRGVELEARPYSMDR
jgi:predicted alpha-1,2-mannosidase